MRSLQIPTLSVALPNYNHSHYLPESLSAILSQSVRPLEVVVVDDCSTDNSVQIIEEIAARDPIVRLIRHTRNRGPNVATNRGVQEAKGDFVLCSAADDVVLPGFFEKSLSLIGQHREAKLCLADVAWFNSETGLIRYVRPGIREGAGFVTAREFAERIAHHRVHLSGAGTIFHRTTLLDQGGFEPELEWQGDWFAIAACAFRHGACYVPEPLVAFRVLATSYSHQGEPKGHRDVFLRLFDLLLSDSYRDIVEPVRRSNVLSLRGLNAFLALRSQPRYRDLASRGFALRVAQFVLATAAGLNPYTPSPIGIVDRAARRLLGENDYIQQYGVKLPSPSA